MSRHLWKGSRPEPEQSPSFDPEPPHLGIFTATLRAVKGLAGRPAPATDPILDKILQPTARETPRDEIAAGEILLDRVELPTPRLSSDATELPQPAEESTEEIPRFEDTEPAEPALTMISRGRHGLW